MEPSSTDLATPTPLARVRDFLGLERNVVVMMSAGIVQSFGMLLWSGYLPKVLEELGARGVMIGAFGTIAALLWVIFPYLGGLLSDRLGRGRAMIVASALAATGCLCHMVAPTWWMFLPGLVLLTASGSFGFMGSLALIGDALPARRRAIGVAVQGVFGSLPGMLAPPVGGALIVWLGLIRGVRASLFVTLILTATAIWLQRRYYRVPSGTAGDQAWDVRSAWRAMRPDLKHLLVADCLVRFGIGMSSIFVVLYVFNVLRASALGFGFLQSLETLTSAVLLVPIAKLADRAGQATRWPFIGATYFFFAAFPLALALIPSAKWLPAVFVTAGLRHLGEPARKALIVDLAEGHRRGSVIGVYYSFLGAMVFPASFIGGWLWEWLHVAPFMVGAGVTGLGLVWFLLLGPKQMEEKTDEMPS